MFNRTTRSSLLRLLAALFTVAMLATACGGSDSDGGSADTSTDTDQPDDTSTDTTDSSDTLPDEIEVEVASEEPVYGGSIDFLSEAEHDNWDIGSANCAAACVNILRMIAEPMFIIDSTGKPQPYLLSAYEPNAEFTEHTFTVREGITFSDGTPLDGAALKTDLDGKLTTLLFGRVLKDVTAVDLVDPMTVKLTLSRPLANLPDAFSDRLGFVLAPSYWGSAAGDRGKTGPTGTGPFTFGAWAPGESLELDKNPSYWRTDDQGRELPFLDQIVVRPVPDQIGREEILRADDAEIATLSNTERPELWTTDWDGGLINSALNRETSYLLLNNAKPPFDNPDARRAVALCTDRESFVALRLPISPLVDGPFHEGNLGYLEDNGFPDFDPVAGRALVEGMGGLDVVYGTTNDPGNLDNARVFGDMWSSNCGINVTIDQFDQGELITKAIGGDFQLFQWRNHGNLHPATEYIWWSTEFAEDAIALNFGRIKDPVIDAALDKLRSTVDPAEMDAAAQEINAAFGENVYNIWYAATEWWLPYVSRLHNVGVLHLPDGGMADPWWAGRVWMQEAWLSE